MAQPYSLLIRESILFTRSDGGFSVDLSNREVLTVESFHVDGIGGVAYVGFSQFTQLPRGKDEP